MFSAKEVISGVGVGGSIPARLGELGSLVLGVQGVALEMVHTRLPTTKSGIFAKSHLLGSVGNGVLRRFDISFSYKDKEVILVRNRSFKSPYHFSEPKGLN